MCLPARVIAKEDERFTITIKYSKLACELDLVSVTMTLPPSRIQFDETPKSLPAVKYLEPESAAAVHKTSVSASSELSSNSSEWYSSAEEEIEKKFSLFEIFEGKRQGVSRGRPVYRGDWAGLALGAQVLAHNRSLMPEGTFYFHDLVYTTRDFLIEALDNEVVEDLVIEFVGVDPKYFVVNIPDMGCSPLSWHRWAQQFMMRTSDENGWLTCCDAPSTAVARSGILKCHDAHES